MCIRDIRMERYRSLLNVPEEMIFFFEPDGFVCERNHLVTNQLEYEEEEALYIQEIFRSIFVMEDDKVKLAGKPEKERFETAVYRKNQTCITASAYICFLDEEETGCYGMCCARNIGKYKEATKDLISAKV